MNVWRFDPRPSFIVFSPLVLSNFVGFNEDGHAKFDLIWPENAKRAYIDLNVLKWNVNLSVIKDDATFNVGGVPVYLTLFLGSHILLERASEN